MNNLASNRLLRRQDREPIVYAWRNSEPRIAFYLLRGNDFTIVNRSSLRPVAYHCFYDTRWLCEFPSYRLESVTIFYSLKRFL